MLEVIINLVPFGDREQQTTPYKLDICRTDERETNETGDYIIKVTRKKDIWLPVRNGENELVPEKIVQTSEKEIHLNNWNRDKGIVSLVKDVLVILELDQ